MGPIDKMEEFIKEQFSESQIEKIARQFDINVENGKEYIGVDSLCEWLDRNALKGLVAAIDKSNESDDFKAAMELVHNHKTIKVILQLAMKFAHDHLKEERKKRAELN